MSNDKTFGELLAFHRSQFGISQEELAELSGVSKIQIARYETNKAKPRRKAIEKLAYSLKITPEDLGYRSLVDSKEIAFNLDQDLFRKVEQLAKADNVSVEQKFAELLNRSLKREINEDPELQKFLKEQNIDF